ncbi:hypothetical protein ACHAPQ_011065, partial [Fusarium lateritium]
MAKSARSAVPNQPPVLRYSMRFVPHAKGRSYIQVFHTDCLPLLKLMRLFKPRRVETLPQTAADKIKTCLFPCEKEAYDSNEQTVVRSFVAGFQLIENHVAPLLADELVKFLIDSWLKDQRQGFDKTTAPKEHCFYNILASEESSTKSLNFGYWFYLATWWGPGHPDLKAIRLDMSALWGVEFPADAMFYPPDISDKDQKRLYAGIQVGPEPAASRPAASPRRPASSQPQAATKAQVPARPASQTRDTEIATRQQQIMDAIENDTVGSVLGKFAANLNPTFRNAGVSANDSGIAKLKSELAAAQKELEESKDKITVLERSLQSLEKAHEFTETTQKTQTIQLTQRVNQQEENLKRANKYANDLERKLSKADDRMDSLEAKLAEADERAKKAVE